MLKLKKQDLKKSSKPSIYAAFFPFGGYKQD